MAVAESLPAKAKNLPSDQHKLDLTFQSKFYKVELSQTQATFVSFAVDSLGQNKLDENVMLPAPTDGMKHHVARLGDTVEYRMKNTDLKPAGSFSFHETEIVIRTVATDGNLPGPVHLGFDAAAAHPTLLGMVTDEGDVKLPAVLHFPAHGSFRLTGKGRNWWWATMLHAIMATTLCVSCCRRELDVESRDRVPVRGGGDLSGGPGDREDPRYDGYRRDFLSIFQLSPRRRALANNSASDATPITVFEYSAMAARLPPLAPGLAAMDLVRQTLERYIGGMSGYGMIAYLLPPRIKWDFLDVYPSLVMAAADYVRATGDKAWNERYYSALRYWAEKMIEFDTDGDGWGWVPISTAWPAARAMRIALFACFHAAEPRGVVIEGRPTLAQSLRNAWRRLPMPRMTSVSCPVICQIDAPASTLSAMNQIGISPSIHGLSRAGRCTVALLIKPKVSFGASKPRAAASALVSLWPSRSRWMRCPPVICPERSVAMATSALRSRS